MKPVTHINMPAIFDKSLNYVINILILYIIILLVFSLGKTLFTLSFLFTGDRIDLNLSSAITDILSFLVMIELFKGFIDYFKAKRIRLHSMIDPAIIFIVRELIVQLYTHENLTTSSLTGFAILILCLGIVRSLALIFSPKNDPSHIEK